MNNESCMYLKNIYCTVTVYSIHRFVHKTFLLFIHNCGVGCKDSWYVLGQPFGYAVQVYSGLT